MAQMKISGRLNIQGRTSVRGISLWSPSALDPILWLDATQLDTLTIDAGRVDEWRDAMGSGRRVTNRDTADANRPEYTATINGINVPTFNGAGYGLDTCVVNQDYTDWLALPFQTETLTFAIIDWFGGSDSDQRTLWQPEGNTLPYTPTLRIDTGTPPKRLNTLIGGVDTENLSNGTSIINSNTGANTIGTGIHIVGNWARDDIHYIHVDGEEFGTTNYSTTNLGAPSSIRIGRSSLNFGTRHFEGGFGEFIHVRSNVSLANVQRIEGYLAHKWGQSALLPIGHPYKNAAPLA